MGASRLRVKYIISIKLNVEYQHVYSFKAGCFMCRLSVLHCSQYAFIVILPSLHTQEPLNLILFSRHVVNFMDGSNFFALKVVLIVDTLSDRWKKWGII